MRIRSFHISSTPGPGRLLRLGWLLLALLAGPVLADEYGPLQELIRSGQLPQAMERVQQALAARPRDPQLRFLKALIEQDSGRSTQAIASYQQLIADYPELPEPHNNLAVLYAAQGQYELARAALEHAIRNNRDYAVAHENLGDVYTRLAGQAYAQSQRLDARNSTVGPKLTLLRQLYAVSAPGGATAQPPASR